MATIDFKFSSGDVLSYAINDTAVAANWLRKIQDMPHVVPDRCTAWNHAHGFATAEQIQDNINYLYTLGRRLNVLIPTITADNWHDVLNKAHTAFPPIHWRNAASYSSDVYRDAHEFNLVIHWLEYELANAYDNRQEFLFNVDFNHEVDTRCYSSFRDDDYAHFSPVLEFGNIHLHYVHIGRHFLELANALDYVCPKAQFVPQRLYSATCGLVFSEPGVRDYNDLRKYYDARGKAYFGMEFGDPRLAQGFYKLGQLVNVHEYQTPAARNALRQSIATSLIVDWQIT